MSRRSKTGGWRSQTQFESRPGESARSTENGMRLGVEATFVRAPVSSRRVSRNDLLPHQIGAASRLRATSQAAAAAVASAWRAGMGG